MRVLSPRDEGIVQANLGRLQGLAQGLDFYVEQFGSGDGKSVANPMGFQIVREVEMLDDPDEENRRL